MDLAGLLGRLVRTNIGSASRLTCTLNLYFRSRIEFLLLPSTCLSLVQPLIVGVAAHSYCFLARHAVYSCMLFFPQHMLRVSFSPGVIVLVVIVELPLFGPPPRGKTAVIVSPFVNNKPFGQYLKTFEKITLLSNIVVRSSLWRCLNGLSPAAFSIK